jgi:uncharacterized protein DUF5681
VSGADKDGRKALARLPQPEAAYEVGYGRPPAATRFVTGRSGNPKGRPKGSRNRPPAPEAHEERLKAIILEEAYRCVPVNEAGGTSLISMAQAVVRSMAVNAAKGKERAQRLFTELLATTERENQAVRQAMLEAAISYKVEWERELERRRRLGIAAPEPLPHPDHVVIDFDTGLVRFAGPVTKEENAIFERWTRYRAMLAKEQGELMVLLADPDCAGEDEVRAELAKTEQALAVIDAALQGSRRALRILRGINLRDLDEKA